VTLVRKRNIQTKRPLLVSEVCGNFFADRGHCVVSAMDPYDQILDYKEIKLLFAPFKDVYTYILPRWGV
jgi:hypothetical protein